MPEYMTFTSPSVGAANDNAMRRLHICHSANSFMPSQKAALCIATLVISAMTSGCISAPPQTIELADVVAEQSIYLERSHRDLVRLYFTELERRVDNFVDSQWTPDFLNRALQNEMVQEELEKVQAGLAIDPDKLRDSITDSNDFSNIEAEIIVNALENAKFDYRVQFGEVMIDFSDAALLQINAVRKELKKSFKENERELQKALDEGYGNLRSGQAELRAYLASVVELVAQQDRVLEKLGLIEARDQAMETILKVSDKAAEAEQLVVEAESIFDRL